MLPFHVAEVKVWPPSIVAIVPEASGIVRVLSAERLPASRIPKKVAPADSRSWISLDALLSEMSKAPVWFQLAVNAPRAIVGVPPYDEELPEMPLPAVMVAT